VVDILVKETGQELSTSARVARRSREEEATRTPGEVSRRAVAPRPLPLSATPPPPPTRQPVPLRPRPRAQRQRGKKGQQQKKTKNVGDDLARALEEGWIEINMLSLNQSELVDMLDKIRLARTPMKGLRLAVFPKGADDMIAELTQGTSVLQPRPYDFLANKHAAGHQAFRDALASEKHRKIFAALLTRTVSTSSCQKCEDLALCFPLPKAFSRSLSLALPSYHNLTCLNLAGSRIGDRQCAEITTGVRMCKSLRRLILAGCNLSDVAIGGLAGLVKGHSANREVRRWEANLRTYPPLPASKELRQRHEWTVQHEAYAAQLHAGGDRTGLHYLDLSCNLFTDVAVTDLSDALAGDSTLVGIGLRRNQITEAGVAKMREIVCPSPSSHAVETQGFHPSLVFADLRHQGDGQLDDPRSLLVNPRFRHSMPRKPGAPGAPLLGSVLSRNSSTQARSASGVARSASGVARSASGVLRGGAGGGAAAGGRGAPTAKPGVGRGASRMMGGPGSQPTSPATPGARAGGQGFSGAHVSAPRPAEESTSGGDAAVRRAPAPAPRGRAAKRGADQAPPRAGRRPAPPAPSDALASLQGELLELGLTQGVDDAAGDRAGGRKPLSREEQEALRGLVSGQQAESSPPTPAAAPAGGVGAEAQGLLVGAIHKLAEQVDLLQAEFTVVVDEVLKMKRARRERRADRKRKGEGAKTSVEA